MGEYDGHKSTTGAAQWRNKARNVPHLRVPVGVKYDDCVCGLVTYIRLKQCHSIMHELHCTCMQFCCVKQSRKRLVTITCRFRPTPPARMLSRNTATLPAGSLNFATTCCARALSTRHRHHGEEPMHAIIYF